LHPQNSIESLLSQLDPGNYRVLPRLISLVENQPNLALKILGKIPARNIPVIGITGPPGAGKSTLLSGLIEYLRSQNKKIGVIAVDPSSPFSMGSVLGDRIRMQTHSMDPGVFIRSMSSRGNLGGLSASSSDILGLFQAFDFDYIFIETVGVGQSEVEVIGLANCVVVVLVPESGDEVQSIKSGLIEIADILVVNKSDRPGAGKLLGYLTEMLQDKEFKGDIDLLKTQAEFKIGIPELMEACESHLKTISKTKKVYQKMQQIYQILKREKMKELDLISIQQKLDREIDHPDFNLYRFILELGL